jgi:hypothetical protein
MIYDSEALATGIVTLVGLLLYWLYVRKYREYRYEQPKRNASSCRPRGKCPPFFPNVRKLTDGGSTAGIASNLLLI